MTLEFKNVGLIKISPKMRYEQAYTGANGVQYIGDDSFIIENTKKMSLMIPIDIEHHSLYNSDWNVIGFIKTNSLVALEDGIYGEMYLSTSTDNVNYTGLSPVYSSKEIDNFKLVQVIDSVTFTENENFCELSFDRQDCVI